MAKINRDFGRRPEFYNEKDKSNRDMMQDVTEVALRGAGLSWRHSEFKKPSWENNHEAMERTFAPQQPRMGGFSLFDSPRGFGYPDSGYGRFDSIFPIPPDTGLEVCDCELWRNICITIPPEERTGFCLECEIDCIELSGGGGWCNDRLQIIVPSGDIDQTTTNSSKQYFAVDETFTNMNAYVEWKVTGTGATISGSGILATDGTACGSLLITVTDDCNNSDTQEVRVTDSGQWVDVTTCLVAPGACGCGGGCGGGVTVNTYIGKYYYYELYKCCPCAENDGCCPRYYSPQCSGSLPYNHTIRSWKSEWVCL